jgi:hypothetical protein
VVGIDEAGYGPILGPLVVGCCGFELQEPPGDLWQLLRRRVSKTRPTAKKRGQLLHVADSKKVHRHGDLSALELPVLALGRCFGEIGSLDELLAAVGAASPGPVWYRPADDERFPLETDASTVKILGNGLAAELARLEVRPAALWAEVVDEQAFNRQATATRNKAALLFSTAMRHVQRVFDFYDGDETATLHLVLDRHGGRSSYGQLLRTMFPDRPLAVIEESEGHSSYDLGGATLTFAEKADAEHLPVAAASMLAKYLRESLMKRLNRWFADHVPNLEPTAGYWQDGLRFLSDVADVLPSLDLREDDLRRVR